MAEETVTVPQRHPKYWLRDGSIILQVSIKILDSIEGLFLPFLGWEFPLLHSPWYSRECVACLQ